MVLIPLWGEKVYGWERVLNKRVNTGPASLAKALGCDFTPMKPRAIGLASRRLTWLPKNVLHVFLGNPGIQSTLTGRGD